MSLIQFTQLQPLSMGQIIDRAIRLYRRNFLCFLGLAALVQIPTALVSLIPTGLAATSSPIPTPVDQDAYVWQLIGGGLVYFVVAIAAGLWAQVGAGAMTLMAADSYFGDQTGIGDAFRRLGPSWLKLLGTLVLQGLLFLGLILCFIIPCLGQIAAIPGGGLFVFLAVVVTPLLIPVVVIERLGGRPAIRRAWEMARQRFWWLFGFFLLLALFSLVVVQGPSYLFIFTTGVIAIPLIAPQYAAILQVVITALLGVVYLPIQVSCILLVYLDLRIRQEGIDLALQAADGAAFDPQGVLAQTPPLAEAKLVTGSEWGSFIGVTLICAAIFGVFYAILLLFLIPFLNI